MKFIGRAAFWLIDKLVYLLIGKKDFTPTPVPDDWPPDGSMHFLCLEPPYRSARLPPNTVHYEFAENVEICDPVVFTMGREIIFRLCDSRQTLIKFTCLPEYTKSLSRKPATHSLECATQFLRSQVPESTIAQREDAADVLVAAVLSEGCPKELFTQYDEVIRFPSFIDFYLLSGENTLLDSEEGLSLVEQGRYQAELYLDYGPYGLNVILDPEALDIKEVEKVIEEVCHAHNILLMNPPIHLE